MNKNLKALNIGLKRFKPNPVHAFHYEARYGFESLYEFDLLPSKDYIKCVWIVHAFAVYALWTSASSWEIICILNSVLIFSLIYCLKLSKTGVKQLVGHKGIKLIFDAGAWWIISHPLFKKNKIIFKDQILMKDRHRWHLLLQNLL